MNNIDHRKPHWSFWLIGAGALIWNLMGSMNFLMQLNPEFVAAMPDTHQAIIELRPLWATSAFAISVFGGAFGSVLLMLKSSAALFLFFASLFGTILTFVPHAHLIGSTISDPFEIIMMIVMPIAVGIFLVAYARFIKRRYNSTNIHNKS